MFFLSFFSLSARFCVGVFFAKSLAFAKVTAGRSDCELCSGHDSGGLLGDNHLASLYVGEVVLVSYVRVKDLDNFLFMMIR